MGCGTSRDLEADMYNGENRPYNAVMSYRKRSQSAIPEQPGQDKAEDKRTESPENGPDDASGAKEERNEGDGRSNVEDSGSRPNSRSNAHSSDIESIQKEPMITDSVKESEIPVKVSGPTWKDLLVKVHC